MSPLIFAIDLDGTALNEGAGIDWNGGEDFLPRLFAKLIELAQTHKRPIIFAVISAKTRPDGHVFAVINKLQKFFQLITPENFSLPLVSSVFAKKDGFPATTHTLAYVNHIGEIHMLDLTRIASKQAEQNDQQITSPIFITRYRTGIKTKEALEQSGIMQQIARAFPKADGSQIQSSFDVARGEFIIEVCKSACLQKLCDQYDVVNPKDVFLFDNNADVLSKVSQRGFSVIDASSLNTHTENTDAARAKRAEIMSTLEANIVAAFKAQLERGVAHEVSEAKVGETVSSTVSDSVGPWPRDDNVDLQFLSLKFPPPTKTVGSQLEQKHDRSSSTSSVPVIADSDHDASKDASLLNTIVSALVSFLP